MTTDVETEKLVLIPLDERPVNVRYPAMLGAIAGVHVSLPPMSCLGYLRDPADYTALVAWLRHEAQNARAAIVSADMMAFGNLINSRISNTSAAAAIGRLAVLAELNQHVPVRAFGLITRVANANDCVEEPLYWLEWGKDAHRFAALTHRKMNGDGSLSEREQDELSKLDTLIPNEIRQDWLTRRLRNHIVSLSLIEMASRRDIASLLLTSDDTSSFGFPSRERDWLRSWPDIIGPDLQSRVSMHPGADEVGCALVAREINTIKGRYPRVWVEWSNNAGADLVAPYEDRPVRETVYGQIAACGAVIALSADQCDFVLGVVAPSPHLSDYRETYMGEDRLLRTDEYLEFINRLGGLQGQLHPIAIADVAYPNGSDPLFIEMLFASRAYLSPETLCAYGAWNTAGNTVGTVVAHSVCSLYSEESLSANAAHGMFLTHRFLEDYGYQSVVRRAAREYCLAQWGTRDPDPNNTDQIHDVIAFVESGLAEQMNILRVHGIGTGFRLRPGSVRLPWNRLFEVDFDLNVIEG